MPARLVPLIPGSAPSIGLNRPVLLIGRHPECDVRLDLPQVSRRHCCLALAYDRATIRDLGSRHGVRVNGRLIHETRLLPGDEVAIAQLIYRFEDTVPLPAAAVPAEARPVAQSSPAANSSAAPKPEEESLPKLPVDFSELDLGDLFPSDH
jgi:predicted component of type VI protein secretion system